MSLEGNVFNKNNSYWRELVDSQTTSWDFGTNHQASLHARTRGLISGLEISNSAGDLVNDIDIAAGIATDSVGFFPMMLSASLTKRLDAAWSVGTNQGGLDTGAIANTTYHVFLIRRIDTGVVDALFSASPTAPTMPTSYTQFRRIGSIIRAGATILAFGQVNDYFRLATAPLDINVNTTGVGAVTRTLTVPTGLSILAHMIVRVETGATGPVDAFISDLNASDQAPGTATGLAQAACLANDRGTGEAWVRTNASAQVRSRMSASAADLVLKIATLGWRDERGRNQPVN